MFTVMIILAAIAFMFVLAVIGSCFILSGQISEEEREFEFNEFKKAQTDD